MWESYIDEISRCSLCRDHSILDSGAFPIIQKTKPRNTELLFVLEAPNYDPAKGYLTINPDTDPSIEFFNMMYTEVPGCDIQDLFITKSVLCLPKRFASKHPITTLQRNHCAGNLKHLIDMFNPKIVCTIGFQALKALKIIENHGCNSMSSAVGKNTEWYGRKLFPLYRTSRLVRLIRSREEQIEDWHKLNKAIIALKIPLHH
ncbi:MAG: hypothetical protein HOG34_20745 [Bacteroidetes bacterium]|jgi:uracil-DNA glycosylase family 4|nr:hypothetical protein [Bacteroidota bacterium]MBT7462421.1 hypothetical protein [Bacteroidota bacterium]